MRAAESTLRAAGHTPLVPKSLTLIETKGFKKPATVAERLVAEKKYDFIREHFKKIESADAVLVVNPAHHGIDGYIGGNTFLEMGIAFYLGKPIYVLHGIPHMDYELELAAMHPIDLAGDLSALR
jgi:nucleoside 2-deoxyribosyltransferase